MILLVYNPKIYKEYFLPNTLDMDHPVVLEKDMFGLWEDIVLNLEVTKQGWSIKEGQGYAFADTQNTAKSRTLSRNDIVTILTRANERIQLFSADAPAVFAISKKYSLSGVREITIGKGNHNTIVYDYRQMVSSNHAVIRLYQDGFYIEDTSSNGIFDTKGRLPKRKKLEYGDHVNIFGLHIIFLGDRIAVSNPYGTYTVREGYLRECPKSRSSVSSGQKVQAKTSKEFFKRSPRNLPQICNDELEIEAPPQPKLIKKRPLILTIGPSFTMAIPMLLGALVSIFAASSSGSSRGAFMFTGIVTALASAAIGVVWALVNMRYAQKENTEEEQQRFNAYSNYLIHIANILKEKYEQNYNALTQMYPPASVYTSYTKDTNALWNRNINHEDFMFYRLGTGDIPFQMDIKIPKEKFSLMGDSLTSKPTMLYNEYKTLKNVPVGIDLFQKKLFGLVGGKDKKGAIEMMHVLAANIAANNSYTDVKMAFIYRADRLEDVKQWECMKWFPHVWSSDHQTRYMASDEIETGDVCFELSNIIRTRSIDAQENKNSNIKTKTKPYYVLFVSDPSLIEGELLAKYILEPEECYGLTTFLMVESVEQLPNVCEDVLEKDEFFCGYCNLMDIHQEKVPIYFDQVEPLALEVMGRNLSGVQVNEEESTSEIPASLDFFEMYGVNSLEGFAVLDRWRKNRTFHSMKALIGKKAGNADCYLDIHEKYHGPHGLIAGTTGSGKSETLQTYMLSLSLNFSPDDVSFFIIDFKGGGMADLFSNLPHMVGQISNLSGNQVRRAMISIKSENMRRQRMFKENGVNNINLYTRLYKNGEVKTPIPHLFIIIDEFAELKREEPEFMRELISVAQVGRSLGVHLILATQKPSGTVDDNIWSNSKFRLCLRVQDRQDSNDMLHKPDAAFLTQAGRGYLQVGNDEIYELFQSGWSGAVYREFEEGGSAMTAAIITRTGKSAVVGNLHKQKLMEQRATTAGKVKEKTQLEAIVDYLNDVADSNGYVQNMQLWLPVLKTRIYPKDILGNREGGFFETGKWAPMGDKWHLDIYPGFYDDPVHQAQEPLKLSFSEDGHMAVCGTVVSGKSTFLQTVVYSLINNYSPDVVNIYCLDFSSKMMASFENAPHVGGVIFDDEVDRVGKFFHMLMKQLAQRKKLFRGGNYSQYVQAYGLKLPAIVVVIDNYGNFAEKTNNAYDHVMMTLAKEGVSHGIYLAISGAGTGMSEIPGRIMDNIRTAVTLEMGDKYKYMEILRGVSVQVLPETGVKGRGLAVVDGRALEYQTILCMEANDDFERGSKIAATCDAMKASWTGKCASLIPFIPEEPVLNDLRNVESYGEDIQNKRLLPMGYRKADASIYNIALNYTYCYVVSGKAHTGRTNVLKLAIYGAIDKGADVCVMEPDGIKLSKIAQQNQLTYVKDSKDVLNYFKALTPEFVKRNKLKHQWEEEGLNDEEIFDRMSEMKPIFVIISDLNKFCQMIYKPQEGVGNIHGFTETIIEKGRLHNIYFVGAIKPEDASSASSYKVYNLFVNYKAGMHLGGNYSAQRIFNFQNIPYQLQGKMVKRGFGTAADAQDDSMAIDVVLPLAKL